MIDKKTHNLFLEIFDHLYALIHTPLVSYIIILAGLCALILANWNVISGIKQKRNYSKLLLIICFISLICITLFTLWVILFHFHTFEKRN
ncbi:hypothetical protein DID76_00920 [Candidatus Marinamargulisbacteria bacterium SCGC AG-414-C22]|nr:hypothetical protein DID76_00920 [Candidatus Marinamargulisbacteria bacterium SCGC AG-414-C22]